MLAVKALVRLPICAGSSELLLLANVISTKISYASPYEPDHQFELPRPIPRNSVESDH